MDFRKLFISKKIFLIQLYPDLKLLLVSHKFEYYDTEKDTIEIETKDLAKEWQAYNNKIYGRCFTLSPSEKHTRYRIRSIVMKCDYLPELPD